MQPIIYVWQVSACMGVFYGFYFLLLRRLTFFALNRWYLITTLILSFVIPLLTITVHKETAPIVIQKAVIVNQALPSSGFQVTEPVKQAGHSIDWIQVVEIAYLVITVALFIKLVITIGRFFYRLRKASVTRIAGVKIIKGTGGIINGSFFNYILLDGKDLSTQEIEQVMEHEMLHVKRRHSVDRIIVRLAQVVLWFNPFVYRYAQAIEENHEFEVDHEIGRRVDKRSYADMLLHLSVNNQDILFNSFSKVPLKRRITMLFTKPTNYMNKVIYLLVLPVVMISFLAFARFKNDVQTEQYSVVGGVELLNDDFKVVIDGKTYDRDIVYKISNSCIKSVKIMPVAPRVEVVNRKWADAVVNIKTKNGKVVYMTEQEKENLIKERRAGFRFYVRLHLKDNDGKPFDKVIVQQLNGSVSAAIQPQDKVGFLVDDVFYNENDVRFMSLEKFHSLTNDISVDLVKPGQYAKGIAAVFHLHTYKKPVVADTTHQKPKVNAKKAKAVTAVKQTALSKEPKTDYATSENDRSMTYSERQLVQRTFTNPTAPFLNRFHFQRDGGKDFDVVAFNIAGSGGSAILDKNGKIGTFIDGKFYNEEAIKRLSPEKVATLVIDNGADRSKFEKMPEGENYAVPFYFKTKTASGKADTTIRK
ncbi:MAG TPA: M56 family metallopeptidase [Mucilaginibacter sp.]|jgi:hypothetical protein|nr:M56 family metallopeptidase [Mucilaginibacter sp.]